MKERCKIEFGNLNTIKNLSFKPRHITCQTITVARKDYFN